MNTGPMTAPRRPVSMQWSPALQPFWARAGEHSWVRRGRVGAELAATFTTRSWLLCQAMWPNTEVSRLPTCPCPYYGERGQTSPSPADPPAWLLLLAQAAGQLRIRLPFIAESCIEGRAETSIKYTLNYTVGAWYSLTLISHWQGADMSKERTNLLHLASIYQIWHPSCICRQIRSH